MAKKVVVRPGDMHPTRALRVRLEDDGDVMVIITQDGVTIGAVDTGNPEDRTASLEFTVSGERSRHTRLALIALAAAMEKDNAERPISI